MVTVLAGVLKVVVQLQAVVHGKSGGQRGDNANSSNSVSQQISAIQNDQKLKQKVVNMLIAARK